MSISGIFSKLFASTERMQLDCLTELDKPFPDSARKNKHNISSISADEHIRESSLVKEYLLSAGILYEPSLLICSLISLNTLLTYITFYFLRLSMPVCCVFTVLIVYGEWSYVESRVQKRANEFLDDFPSILLAMASSLKAGFTPFDALIRSVESFPDTSLAKKEVNLLKSEILSGRASGDAINSFAKHIRAQEIASFQRALQLTLENGGRFVPSLERMAKSIRIRRILARSVETSTMTMRMTALALVVIGPFVVNIVSTQSPDYWKSVFNDPIPSRIAYTGIALIFLGLITLDRMSKFRP